MVKLLIDAIAHLKTIFKHFKVVLIAFLLVWGISTHIQNKKLSEGLEMAQNNIEAY
jgi:hypothetical protein